MDQKIKGVCYKCNKEIYNDDYFNNEPNWAITTNGIRHQNCENKKYGGFFGGLKKLWDATIFPDMIKEKKEKKAQMKKIHSEAEKEAMEELKPELKKHIKQEYLDKISGKSKQDRLKKFADGFRLPDSWGSQEKINSMLGRDKQQQPPPPQPQQYYYQQPQQPKQKRRRKKKQPRQQKQYMSPSPPPPASPTVGLSPERIKELLK